MRYGPCAGLVNELAEAVNERRLSRLLARDGRLALTLMAAVPNGGLMMTDESGTHSRGMVSINYLGLHAQALRGQRQHATRRRLSQCRPQAKPARSR